MDQRLMAELNEMKQRRERIEKEMNMKINQYHDQLRRLDKEIAQMNEAIRLEKANESGSDRSSNWNRELEGTWSVEKEYTEKLYEREHVFDTAHRE